VAEPFTGPVAATHETVSSTSALTIVVVYPELMGTYGDGGNAVALKARCTRRGIAAEILEVHAPDAVPHHADVYLIGGAENASQTTAARLLDAEGGLRSAAERGATVLGICGGYQVLGESITDAAGTTTDGLGLLDVRSAPLAHRAVGDIAITPLLGGLPELVGFENHAYGTRIGASAVALGVVVGGVGNGLLADDATRTEGAVQGGTVIGTYLHGPLLALNPALADLLLEPVLGTLDPLDDTIAAEVRAARRGVVAARR
jgi:lipid II isoglutaminyl synthase (glutamine-hydrolysing)